MSRDESLTLWVRAGAAATGLVLALSAGFFSTHAVAGDIQTTIRIVTAS